METKSIICRDNETCYLCGRYGHLERHHCIGGTANRRLADEDGLTVYLCRDCHHRRVHGTDKEARDYLHKTAQMAWMESTGGTIDDFRARYGRNYL